MKLTTLFIMLLTCFNVINGQNLVNNGSFEIFSMCPTSSGQFHLVADWSVPPNTGTSSPDYFNNCNSGNYGVPGNTFGYQYAHDGVAYAGITTYYASTPNFREYLQTHLINPLVEGQSYHVSFMVSKGKADWNSSNNLGVVLSTTQINGTGAYTFIDAIPQMNVLEIVTNSDIWTEISGTYTASGGEEYLTIGNFFNDEQTAVTQSGFFTNPAYYFIDSVSVMPLNLGIIETRNKPIKVYPNPFKTSINLLNENDENNIENVKIITTLGQVKTLTVNSNKIDLSDLESGIYYLVIKTFDGKISTLKIVKI